MAKKYYAIKSGRKIGIVNSWDECKSYVDGFANAVYKSFSNLQDAKNYIYGDDEIGNVSRSPELIAYIDGSYDDTLKRYSYGVITFMNGKKFEYSNCGNDEMIVELRNVAGELKAAVYVMKLAQANEINSVDIYYDYNGIEMWATGKWKANLPFTKAYAEYAKNIMKTIDIKFLKVKSHSGNKYNEEVDKLAKQALNNFTNNLNNELEIGTEVIKDIDNKLEIDTEIKQDIEYQLLSNIKGSKSNLGLGNIMMNKKLITTDDVYKVFKQEWKKRKRLLKDINEIKAYYDKDNDYFIVFVITDNELKKIIITGEQLNG